MRWGEVVLCAVLSPFVLIGALAALVFLGLVIGWTLSCRMVP